MSKSVLIKNNNLSSVNLGIFVRGGASTGNRIFENVIVGGGNPANNLLGICYNPAPNAGQDGPRGDNIYNNLIARFNFAVAISPGSIHNIFNENNFASFTRVFVSLKPLLKMAVRISPTAIWRSLFLLRHCRKLDRLGVRCTPTFWPKFLGYSRYFVNSLRRRHTIIA